MDYPTFVPAFTHHQNAYNNGVIVNGGTNWDISRKALETPISRIQPTNSSTSYTNAPNSVDSTGSATPHSSNQSSATLANAQTSCYCLPFFPNGAYLPSDPVPTTQPTATLQFSPNQASLSSEQLSYIATSLDKSRGVIVAAHAAPQEKRPSTLSKQRALAVSKYLKSLGFTVYYSESFSSSRPTPAPNTSSRVDIWSQLHK